MKTTIHRLLLALTAATIGALTFSGSPALAQESSSKKKVEVLQPPTPPAGKSEISWLSYATAIILGGLIAGVNFIPSKRGHQD